MAKFTTITLLLFILAGIFPEKFNQSQAAKLPKTDGPYDDNVVRKKY